MPKDPIKEKERKRLSGIKHREARNARRKEKYNSDTAYRQKQLDIRKRYRDNNLEQSKLKESLYKKRNREKVNSYRQNKYKNDPNFRLAQVIRVRMRKFIKNKSQSSKKLMGADIETVKKHLENLFQEGMNWDNHGNEGWHIDHIIPCAAFDLTDPKQQKKCFHYTNLQPLWARDNLSKSDTYEH
jgi:hypothetical protein